MSHAHNLAWAAGFFDGDGYVCIQRRKQTINGKVYIGHYLRAGVNHVGLEPVRFCHKLFGGSLELQTKTQGNRKPRWQWCVNTKQAEKFLVQIMPYLHNKQRAAEIGLELQRTMLPNKTKWLGVSVEVRLLREMLRDELITLNAKD